MLSRIPAVCNDNIEVRLALMYQIFRKKTQVFMARISELADL